VRGPAIIEPDASRDMAENNTPEPDPYEDEQVLWSLYRRTRQSAGIDIDKVYADCAERVKQGLPSPGAREDFAELCEDGCHAHAVAAIITLIRHCPQLEDFWKMIVGPPEKRQKVIRALENAAASLEEVFKLPLSLENEENRTEFAKGTRIPPSRMISELRVYARLIKLAESLRGDTGVHSLAEVSKYILSGYVKRMTGSFHDRNVSGLIGEAVHSPDYNEVAHRMWRRRNYKRLEKNFTGISDLVVAIGIVMSRPA
jgi:phosphohistidine phosphatase SixA